MHLKGTAADHVPLDKVDLSNPVIDVATEAVSDLSAYVIERNKRFGILAQGIYALTRNTWEAIAEGTIDPKSSSEERFRVLVNTHRAILDGLHRMFATMLPDSTLAVLLLTPVDTSEKSPPTHLAVLDRSDESWFMQRDDQVVLLKDTITGACYTKHEWRYYEDLESELSDNIVSDFVYTGSLIAVPVPKLETDYKFTEEVLLVSSKNDSKLRPYHVDYLRAAARLMSLTNALLRREEAMRALFADAQSKTRKTKPKRRTKSVSKQGARERKAGRTKLPPLKVFVSYARRDRPYIDSLKAHLRQLERDKEIAIWTDHDMPAGDHVDNSIAAQLAEADIVILAVSAWFLNSEYCNSKELGRALSRHQKGETRVIPVLLRDCDWQKSRFGKLNAIPAKPVNKYPRADDGWTEVARKLRNVVDTVRRSDN